MLAKSILRGFKKSYPEIAILQNGKTVSSERRLRPKGSPINDVTNLGQGRGRLFLDNYDRNEVVITKTLNTCDVIHG